MVPVKEEYIINSDNTVRYVLGKYNRRPLIVFGINPSVATAEKNDSTISIAYDKMTFENFDMDDYFKNVY